MDQRTWIEEDISAMHSGWSIRHLPTAIEYTKSLETGSEVVISVAAKEIEPSSVSILYNMQFVNLPTSGFDSSLWLAWDLCGRKIGLLESHLQLGR